MTDEQIQALLKTPIEALRADLKEERKRVEMLTAALERIVNADYPRSPDQMQQIAREALE